MAYLQLPRLCSSFALVLVIVSSLVCPIRAELAKVDRPNVLILFADDWGRYASAYSKYESEKTLQSLVRTPNIDRIATNGVLFRKAFVSAPSCTPCRSALLSGQHFWRTGQGAILQGARWDASIPAFPLLLHESGYHIGESFKVWSPGSPGDAPYGAGKFAYEKSGRGWNDFSENVTKMMRSGSSFSKAKNTLLEEVAANFDQFLDDRPADKPFCYWFGPTNVHRQWVQGSGKKLWGFNPEDFQGKLPPFLPDVDIVREDFADYFGEIAAYDAAVGVLLGRLQSSGLAESTIVIVSGDHGPPGFPHGKCNLYSFGTSVTLAISGPKIPGNRVIDDLVSLTDIAPTILESAGLTIPKNMTGKSLVPLLQSERNGKLDPARDAVFVGRERHVESARSDWTPYPQRGIRTDDYLLIVNFRPDRWPLGDPYGLESAEPPSAEEIQKNTRATHPDEDAGPTKAWLVTHRNDPRWKAFYERAYGKRPRVELYDLRKDPYEMQNVASDPAYQQVVRSLEERLMNELKSTGDPRVHDDGSFFETAPMAGPLQAPRGVNGRAPIP
ncbi:MAG: Choline-sulfatase [Planctomycetota bacterium]